MRNGFFHYYYCERPAYSLGLSELTVDVVYAKPNFKRFLSTVVPRRPAVLQIHVGGPAMDAVRVPSNSNRKREWQQIAHELIAASNLSKIVELSQELNQALTELERGRTKALERLGFWASS